MIAAVVARPTGRAVCLALAEALRRFGIPAELLTDNGKQFTTRFGPTGGETMFDRICRENGITHLLTAPRSPTTTGKVERFHQTLQRELLDDHSPFASIPDAQAAVDAFTVDYNTVRPHQSLGMAFPTDRFTPRPADALGLRLPPSLTDGTEAQPVPLVPRPRRATATPKPPPLAPISDVDLAVEVDRMVPASGNLAVCGQQFWFGPNLGGVTITLWADTTVVHLIRDGHRLKTVPSRLTTTHLRQLLAGDGRPAGPPPLAPGRGSGPVEVDRLVNAQGIISIASQQCPVGYHLAGQRVTIRLDGSVMAILDLDRTLIRNLPDPLPSGVRPRDGRPGGPPPVVPDSPPPVQRRVSERGVIQVARQKINVGITHAGLLVDVHTADATWRVHHNTELLVEVPRTTTLPVARFKAHKPEPPRRTRAAQPDVEV